MDKEQFVSVVKEMTADLNDATFEDDFDVEEGYE